ncbi:MAG: transcriptional regulator [Verrucomicrobia bacterium]|nr:transcriptional regulator [Verrucomicrobiota bacterium]
MTEPGSPYDALARVFHEPNRLAIMSALAAEDKGIAFTDLKATCNLTDGNLSRHLKALEDTGAVRIEKSFVGVKPRTTISMTVGGRAQFTTYLDALEQVLRAAEQAVAHSAPTASPPLGNKATA